MNKNHILKIKSINSKQVLTFVIFLCSNLLYVNSAYSIELQAKLDSQLRFDDRSGRSERYQYRVRFYPSVILDNDRIWSVNAFAATGDDFSSSHNTLDDDHADFFYLRRAYLRREDTQGKSEIGILPTYKGRVSSTGLSKDGWIAGIRHVANLSNGKFEIVLGELEYTQASIALNAPEKLNYVELEYSGNLNQRTSIEFSLERLLNHNFVTGEIRYHGPSSVTYAAEVIDKLDASKFKVVLSAETGFNRYSQEWEVFAYYSYVSNELGGRAELTEDFLATGHGVAIEVTSSFNSLPFDWFAKFEAYKSNSRVQLGLKYSLTL